MFDHNYWEKLNTEIPGWMSKEEAEFLVENVQGNVYFEVGVAYGKSIRIVRHHFPEVAIIGIDKINHDVDKKVEVGMWYGDANELVYDCNDETISTLFIDGDHTYFGCLSDFVHWYNKVESGGKIIFHDYRRDKAHEGVTQAVDAIKLLLKDFKFTKCIACGTKS